MPITKPVVNGSSGTWGTILNAALDDLDGRLTTATTANGTQDTTITTLTSRMNNAETNITSLQSSVGTTYSSRAALPSSANNGSKATTTDSGLTWTYYNGYWYPPAGSVVGSLFQSSAGTSMTTGTPTLVQLDSTRSTSYPIGSYATGSNASFAATVPGWYTASGGVSFVDSVAGTGYRLAALYKGTSTGNAAVIPGGTNVCAPNQQNATTTSVSTRTVSVLLAPGDRIYLYGAHSQSGSLSTSTQQSYYSTLNVVFAGWFPTS